jgi:hypothetical protein
VRYCQDNLVSLSIGRNWLSEKASRLGSFHKALSFLPFFLSSFLPSFLAVDLVGDSYPRRYTTMIHYRAVGMRSLGRLPAVVTDSLARNELIILSPDWKQQKDDI